MDSKKKSRNVRNTWRRGRDGLAIVREKKRRYGIKNLYKLTEREDGKEDKAVPGKIQLLEKVERRREK